MKRVAIGLGIVAAAVLGWYLQLGPRVDIDIPSGASAAETAKLLTQSKVLWGPTLFRALSKVFRLDRKLNAGTYSFRLRMGAPGALWVLGSGRSLGIRVVIPEGFRAAQIAERLEAQGILRSTGEFLRRADADRLEGYLFPTTYFLSKGMEPAEVARIMKAEFDKQVLPVYEDFRKQTSQSPLGRSLDLHQTVALASIVEREAVIPAEKPTIAAVYLNRLKRRKPLEADPTVQYALGRWKKNLTHKDLEVSSPYNTYAHFGLPPGPIASPGLESIRAVLMPARTDALYFVADNRGGHTFSVTYEEHLKAKADAKRERRRKLGGERD